MAMTREQKLVQAAAKVACVTLQNDTVVSVCAKLSSDSDSRGPSVQVEDRIAGVGNWIMSLVDKTDVETAISNSKDMQDRCDDPGTIFECMDCLRQMPATWFTAKMLRFVLYIIHIRLNTHIFTVV